MSQIMLLSRTIRKKDQVDGYRLTINNVYRVVRDRDPAPYTDECKHDRIYLMTQVTDILPIDDGKVFKKSDEHHVIQISTPDSGIQGLLMHLDLLLETVLPAIPLHALVNMYNSSIHDLTVTANRKVPEFGAYWKDQTFDKADNVLAREAKDLGLDDIPKDAMDRLQAMFDEITASGEALQFAEVGREVLQPDGRKEYVPVGYTVNSRPVEAAVMPWFKRHFKNIPRTNFLLTTDP
jgi:hypothetical protein